MQRATTKAGVRCKALLLGTWRRLDGRAVLGRAASASGSNPVWVWTPDCWVAVLRRRANITAASTETYGKLQQGAARQYRDHAIHGRVDITCWPEMRYCLTILFVSIDRGGSGSEHPGQVVLLRCGMTVRNNWSGHEKSAFIPSSRDERSFSDARAGEPIIFMPSFGIGMASRHISMDRRRISMLGNLENDRTAFFEIDGYSTCRQGRFESAAPEIHAKPWPRVVGGDSGPADRSARRGPRRV